MMHQGANTQSLPPPDPGSVEGQYVVNAQGHISSYVPSTTGSEAATWARHQADNYSIENGAISNSNYHHGQQAELTTQNGQDRFSVTSVVSSSSSATVVAPQEYSDYSTYSTGTDPYAYGGSGYPGYYSVYQQQPNYSHLHQQPNNPYTVQQPNHSYSQHQPNHSFSQPVGAYQNTGAAYQPISSFQNSGSYAGTTSYSTTYYNPGDYQTAGGYTSSGYSNQTTSWNDVNYASYASQQYPSYTASATGGYTSSITSATSANYQQHDKQWADYYSQTEVTCAPGTEHLYVASTSTQGTSISGTIDGYMTPISHTSSYSQPWKGEYTSYEVPSLQPGLANTVAHDGAWKQGTPNASDNLATPLQPQFQKSLDTKSTYDNNFQEQQKIASQVPNLQYPAAHQVSQSYQPLVQSLPPLDARRVSKFQIPTNPRIATSLTMGSSKTEKEGSTSMTAAKPAYISVSLPKPNEKVNAADSMLKATHEPGTFPKSLRDYVERAFCRCSDDRQMAACQAIMKELITKASADGTLYTRDWDIEPLFPLPDLDLVNKDNSETVPSVASLPKTKRSPSKRPKSRWEPLPEEKPLDKAFSVGNETIKYSVWDRKPFIVNPGSKIDVLSSTKISASDQKTPSRTAYKQVKRPRVADGVDVTDNGDASSDSDKEQSLTAYYSGAIALANNPEEKRRRESRSKRFEKPQVNRAEISYFQPNNVGVGNLHSRRASALMLSRSFDDDGSRAVEDIDWDSLTVKGTCQEIEKRYLRLTSAPDPSTVRPEEVLEKALLMVQNSQKNYLYKCDQLKSIRQDLTVQRIRNELTVKVYETHARLALEVGDLPEYNQCQSQLKTLYAEGIEGCHMEFAAYNLLCVILHSNNNRDLLSSMSRLTEEAKKDEAVKHAIAVRAAVNSGNYVMFFRLYKTSPNLNSCLMDLCVEKMRYKAVSCMAKAYRPMVHVSYISKILGFSSGSEENSEKDSNGLGECVEWLKAHGACLIKDDKGEMQFDAKASSSSLYMPEPEDAVAHGDASLAVNDFLTQTSLQK